MGGYNYNEKSNMYVVLKVDDINKYLNDEQIYHLKELINTISEKRHNDGKNKENYYHVCNVDEPYADKVFEAIIRGELCKKENIKPCGHSILN